MCVCGCGCGVSEVDIVPTILYVFDPLHLSEVWIAVVCSKTCLAACRVR